MASGLRGSQPPAKANIRLRSTAFRHPGYRDNLQILSLAHVDTEDGVTLGVHHRTALVACQIIAGNRFNEGFFALTKDGEPVQTPLDGLLTQEEYYFIILGCNEAYPIVPSFRDWQFPHSRIPEYWKNAAVPPSSFAEQCAVTNTNWATEGAHLVPREECLWYAGNDMQRYAPKGATHRIDPNLRNTLPLRSDLHCCFDKRWFAIAPKPLAIGTDPPTARMATHILNTDARELYPTYHNVGVHHNGDDYVPYLFARFAWAVLFDSKSFVTGNKKRHIVYLEDARSEEWAYTADWVTGCQLDGQYGGGGATSSKQRSEKRSKPHDRGDAGPNADDDISLSNWVYKTGWFTGAQLLETYGNEEAYREGGSLSSRYADSNADEDKDDAEAARTTETKRRDD